MKRVLIYTPTVGRGGVHRVVQKLTQGFARDADPAEWQFEVLGQTFDEIGLRVEYPSTWAFEQLDPGPDIPRHPAQFNWLNQQTETFVDHLKRRAGAFDLIYCPSPWWTMRVKDFTLPIPFVTTLHDFAFDVISMGAMVFNFRHISKRIADQCDFTIFPSDYWRRHGEHYYGFQQTRTIPHSADFVADDFEATAEEGLRVRIHYNLPDQYIWAFHPLYHKGIETLLQAQKIARSISPAVPPLVVAGIGTEHLLTDTPVDSHIQAVRALMAEVGVNPGVDFFALGRIPDQDIAGLTVGALVAVIASHMEGDLSGPLFEAMMASTPLIFSDLPVFTDHLGLNMKYGIHFPVGNVAALANAIVIACEDRGNSRVRALNAFGFTRQRTLKDVITDYLGVFTEVLDGRHG